MKKTRFIPYGYTIRDGRTIVEHTEATVIRGIFTEYIKGASLKEIAEDLTGKRIPYTEKTDSWDKARIARIIDNAKYIGTEEYDPIIDEELYSDAVAAKAARQRNTIERECEAISLLRSRIKCEKCGAPMLRHICSKRQIKESWTCSNAECFFKIRISDGDLLRKITILMNRIIENSILIVPKPNTKYEDSPAVRKISNEMTVEAEKPNPSEEYIVNLAKRMASQMYQDSHAKENIIAQIARKRVSLMKPQENFHSGYFADLIDYVTIGEHGHISLHTKTNTEISEGEVINECPEDSET